MNNKALSILLIFCLFLISGCGEEKAQISQQPQPSLAQAQPPLPNTASRTYPCRDCDVVKLETFLPAQVEAGKEFPYRIRVTNISGDLVTNVIVTLSLIHI